MVIKPHHAATRPAQHRITRRRIPLHRPPQPRVKVGLAGRHQTELQARPRRFHILDRIFGNVFIGRLIPVAFRRHHHQCPIIWPRHPNLPQCACDILVKRPGLLHRIPIRQGIKQPVLCRGIDHAAQWHAIFHVSDVHGEIAAPLHELLGAIQRVHNQERRSAQRMARRLLFGDQHQVRIGRAQASRDDLIRRLIRLGHRAGVAFRLHRKIRPVVNLHDSVARFERQSAENRD